MGRTRTNRVEICMNDNEKKILLEKMEKSGMSARATIMTAIKDMPLISTEVHKDLIKINMHFSEQYRLLKKMSDNLNQIAKVCNTYNCLPDEVALIKLAEDLKRSREELVQIWELLKLSLQNLEQR